MSNESSDHRSVLSRGEIESACLLNVIPDEGCALSELPARLGLSPLLEEPVAESMIPLINAGWVHEAEGRVALSPTGRSWLQEKLQSDG